MKNVECRIALRPNPDAIARSLVSNSIASHLNFAIFAKVPDEKKPCELSCRAETVKNLRNGTLIVIGTCHRAGNTESLSFNAEITEPKKSGPKNYGRITFDL
jgi:hypothetical protein